MATSALLASSPYFQNINLFYPLILNCFTFVLNLLTFSTFYSLCFPQVCLILPVTVTSSSHHHHCDHLPFSLFTICSPTKFSLSKLLLYRVLILHFQLSDLFLYSFRCFTSTLNLTDIKVNTFCPKPMLPLDLNIFIYDNIVFSVMWARNRLRNSSMFLLLLTLPSQFSNK